MARLARTIVPGVPHHITQRGNRRLPVFFRPEDYHAYSVPAPLPSGARKFMQSLAHSRRLPLQ